MLFFSGHCKKLTPIYDELGEKMRDEDVEIVKMDATANDVATGYDVRGFPTLYWVPAGSKVRVAITHFVVIERKEESSQTF